MKNVSLIFLSALLFFLSYAPFKASFLIYIAFVPLYFVIINTQNINYIIIFSIVIAIIMLSFILLMNDILVYTRIVFFVLLLSWIMIFLFIYFNLFCRLKMNLWANALLLANVWVVIDIISQKLFNFSWFLYLTQYKCQIALLLGKLLGIHFITFLIILCNYLIFRLLLDRRWLQLISVIIGALFLTFGNTALPPSNPAENIHVWVIQPNQSLDEKNQTTSSQYNQDMMFYSLFNEDLFNGNKIDFIVWPETVTDFYLLRIPDYKEHLLKLAKEVGAYLIIGSRDLDPNLKEYNAAFVITPEGSIERYAKIQTVPMIEKRFSPGNTSLQYQTKHGMIDFLICWESLSFQTETPAQITFILTSDLSMGKTYIPLGHSLLGVFNAISRNSSEIVASYTGPSMMIDQQGQIHARSPMFRPFIIKNTLPLSEKPINNLSIPIILYLAIFIISLFLKKQGMGLVFQRVKPLYWLLAVLFAVCSAKVSMLEIERLNRKVLPQPQIYNSGFKQRIGLFELHSEKKVVRDLLQYYGVWLEKYLSIDEIHQFSVDEILFQVGWEMVKLEPQHSISSTIPILVKAESGWRIEENYSERKVSIRDQCYVVKPLLQNFDN